MSDVQVALAVSDSYAGPLATLVRSLLDHHRGATVHVLRLSGGTGPSQQLGRLVEGGGGTLHVHTVEGSELEALPSSSRFGGRIQLTRMLFPRLVPHLKRILFLDVDTLVVDCLDELWGLDLEGAALGAVPNVVEPAMEPHIRSLGIGIDDVFNSGVMLVDLDRVRAEGAFDAVLDLVGSCGKTSAWFDQDALNVVFAGKWKRLHPRWNAMNSLWTWERWAVERFGRDAVEEARRHPAILHFEGPGPNKPWHYLSEHPWRGRYLEVRSRTPYGHDPLEERTVLTRALRPLPPSWRVPLYWRAKRARRLGARVATRLRRR